MNKTTAVALRDALLSNRRLSDFHDLASVDDALAVVHAAGLAAGFVPLAWPSPRTAKSWRMHLAIFDLPAPAHVGEEIQLSSAIEAPTLVHSLTEVRPMTEYLGDLAFCNLGQLWWSAETFFRDISRALAPWTSDHQLGRSHWGGQDRAAFAAAFEQRWQDDSFILKPAVPIHPKRIGFDDIPLQVRPASSGSLLPEPESAGLPA